MRQNKQFFKNNFETVNYPLKFLIRIHSTALIPTRQSFFKFSLIMYRKPDSSQLQELQDIAHRLRIHSITSTQASKSG